PAWWLASSSQLPEPFQVPLAPCQFPERRRKRLPSASTIQRPRVLSGGVQPASASVTARGAAGAVAGASRACAEAAVAVDRGATTRAAASVALTRSPRTMTALDADADASAHADDRRPVTDAGADDRCHRCHGSVIMGDGWPEVQACA